VTPGGGKIAFVTGSPVAGSGVIEILGGGAGVANVLPTAPGVVTTAGLLAAPGPRGAAVVAVGKKGGAVDAVDGAEEAPAAGAGVARCCAPAGRAASAASRRKLVFIEYLHPKIAAGNEAAPLKTGTTFPERTKIPKLSPPWNRLKGRPLRKAARPYPCFPFAAR
jgi:hypothetical protein